jgi:hypothetical protein
MSEYAVPSFQSTPLISNAKLAIKESAPENTINRRSSGYLIARCFNDEIL